MERFLVYRAKPGKNHNAHGIAFAAQPQAIFFIRTPYEESRQKSRGANAILALNEYPNINYHANNGYHGTEPSIHAYSLREDKAHGIYIDREAYIKNENDDGQTPHIATSYFLFFLSLASPALAFSICFLIDSICLSWAAARSIFIFL